MCVVFSDNKMTGSKRHHQLFSKASIVTFIMMLAFVFAVVSPAPHASASEPVKQEHNHDHDTDTADNNPHDPNHHFHSYGGEIDHTPVTLHYIKPIKEQTGFASSWDAPPNEQVPSNSPQTLERPPRSLE